MDLSNVIAVDPDAPSKRTLLATDRCDTCGAQAYVRYAMRQGDLTFCAHHSNRLHSVLISQGASISEDDRPVLIAEESGMN